MRFGSVCSGIEAASVAWQPLGWTPAWFAEIEPFPAAVLAHHYPDVPNLGDMTKLPEMIRSGEVEAPDVFCGGTPCQAFSVAGLRRSLDDARGNLSLTFCEIANAIDDVRRARGELPTVIFWENVPGVLSTKDNAFGCFLSALAGCDTAIETLAETGWTDAGVVAGPERTVSWRVLDAQYFGLAQRRRRVFVVASARDGFDPAEVLFEFDGVRRDSAPSREAGEGVAGCLTGGASLGGSGPAGRIEMATTGYVQPYPVANCLTARMHKGINSTLDEGQTPVVAWTGDGVTADPISASEGKTYTHEGTTFRLHNCVSHYRKARRARSTDDHETWVDDHITNTLNCFDVGDIRSTDIVTQPVALQDVRAVNKSQNGRGWNDDGTAYTVDTHATQGVAVAFQPGNLARGAGSQPSESVFPTLKSDHGRGASDQQPHVMAAMQVRRLTPTECERLQGFPDGYTQIPWRKKPASECPDGPRYKALGNSWAVPVVRWIGKRIARAA